MRIVPANAANTQKGASPVPVRACGWSVSEPPVSAVSHRLPLLIFHRGSFFSFCFLHVATVGFSLCCICASFGLDDAQGLLKWSLVCWMSWRMSDACSMSHQLVTAWAIKVSFSYLHLLQPTPLYIPPPRMKNRFLTDLFRVKPCGSESLSNCCLKEPLFTCHDSFCPAYSHVYSAHIS